LALSTRLESSSSAARPCTDAAVGELCTPGTRNSALREHSVISTCVLPARQSCGQAQRAVTHSSLLRAMARPCSAQAGSEGRAGHLLRLRRVRVLRGLEPARSLLMSLAGSMARSSQGSSLSTPTGSSTLPPLFSCFCAGHRCHRVSVGAGAHSRCEPPTAALHCPLHSGPTPGPPPRSAATCGRQPLVSCARRAPRTLRLKVCVRLRVARSDAHL